MTGDANATPGSGQMFDAIAPRYDLVNRLISLGRDQAWRRATVRALDLSPGAVVLDLATGTGDLALMIAREHPGVTVIGTDPSRGMLDLAVDKARARSAEVSFAIGDAQAIDREDASVDAITMAFGIRNVPDRPRALREMARVLKPGGRAAILELGEPRSGALASLARLHIHTIVPRIGGLLSGAREYGYLQRSIAAFPPPEVFAAMMEEAGFTMRAIEPMTLGSVVLFVGERRGA